MEGGEERGKVREGEREGGREGVRKGGKEVEEVKKYNRGQREGDKRGGGGRYSTHHSGEWHWSGGPEPWPELQPSHPDHHRQVTPLPRYG